MVERQKKKINPVRRVMKSDRFTSGPHDEMMAREFIDVLANRYLPVLSFTYIATIIGIAMAEAGGDFIVYLIHEEWPYMISLLVGLWVTVPAVIWILLRASVRFNQYADTWYKISAGLMATILLLSLLLFPPYELPLLGGVRQFIVAALPIHFVMYFFFVKGGLQPLYSMPLTLIGAAFFIYGWLVI